eukprot:m.228297 g.228297  ORF g.228297 m.228297 type:complete len:729 (-) comp11723_c0_seq1:1205-3391(-)
MSVALRLAAALGRSVARTSLAASYHTHAPARSIVVPRLSLGLRGLATNAASTTPSSPPVPAAPAAPAAPSEPIAPEDPLLLKNFAINARSRDSLIERGIDKLFPIQAATFTPISQGKDVVAKARTGTGKTLSFVLPLLEALVRGSPSGKGRKPRVLVLAPTRELAKQTCEEFDKTSRGQIRTACIYGGASYMDQESQLTRGVDVIVGTPGRIIDLIDRGTLGLSHIRHVVLDEADRMLEMGFEQDVDKIMSYVSPDHAGTTDAPEQKPQFMMFSATLPGFITKAIKRYMSPDYVSIDMVGDAPNKTAETVEHLAMMCSRDDWSRQIPMLLRRYLEAQGRAIIFTATKHEATDVAFELEDVAEVLHGDISQEKREKTMERFRRGKFRCLVATDVMARGVDVTGVDLVIHLSPPGHSDSYIHRAGRTGRAGREGVSIVLFEPNQNNDLRDIERFSGVKFQHLSPPTAEEQVQHATEDAVARIASVPKGSREYFLEAAKSLMEKEEPASVLAASLAALTNLTDIGNRSLVSGQLRHKTLVLAFQEKIRTASIIYTVMSTVADLSRSNIAARLSEDRLRVAFDLPLDLARTALKSFRGTSRITLTEAESLEGFEEHVTMMQPRGRSSDGGSDGGRGGRDSSRGRRDGNWGSRGRRDGSNDRRSDSRDGYRSRGGDNYRSRGSDGDGYRSRGSDGDGYRSRGRDGDGQRSQSRGRDNADRRSGAGAGRRQADE